MSRTSLVELPPALTAPPHTRGDVRWLLGVDGGATKTLAAVLDLQTRSLHLGHAGPSNEDAVGAQAAVRALTGAADAALAGAGVTEAELGATVAAVAGTDTASIAGHVRNACGDAWIVVNDVVGAWATATEGGPGVGAISGTGSNVFGVGAAGNGWRTGGWGHLLGDEGSGYWLGSESIRACLKDRDASGPPTALGRAACAFFDCAAVEAVASLVYSKPLTKAEISAFAVECARVAAEGDAVAAELFARGATLLGDQVAAVIAQTGLEGSFPIGLIGSTYKAGEIYLDPLRARIAQAAPSAEISQVEMPPAGGSLLLAAVACGMRGQLDGKELAELLGAALAA
jgi:N-acetylglucosamine kinase-like BadF-type ATPase